MDIKQLEKATRMLSSIKEIDQEIIDIEKIAMILANSDTESSFVLKIIDQEQRDKSLAQEKQEDDESPARSFLAQFMTSGLLPHVTRDDKDDFTHTINASLSVNVTMQILGVLLYEKQNKRTKLIKRLESYGINI